MKFGLHLGGGAPACERETLKAVARLADELGYDSIMTGDHIVLPKRITSDWPYEEYAGEKLVRGSPFYAIYAEMEWIDAFDTLAFLAAATEKVRLGTSVLIVPYRHPFDVARRVATVDVLSGGRFILGAGVGWMEEEFRLLGIPFKERAQRTREYLRVMQALWTEEQPRFSGQFVELNEDVNVLPRPLQKPHPPIWIGGESVPALRRVVDFGSGWQSALLTKEQFRTLHAKLRELMAQAGRDMAELELTALTGPDSLEPEWVETYRAAGVSILYMTPVGREKDAILSEMRTFAQQVGAIA